MADFAAENPPEKAAEQIPVSFLDEILDPSLDSIPGLKASDSNEEEEELEWLLNKDAFPPLETMVTSAPSPVSVLAMKVPVKARSKSSRKKRETLPRILAAERRKCRHCEAEETPQWRTGPEGPKTLCNACGVRFRKGRLVEEYRPINSPTFRAELHSNSHKRIVGMKRRKVEVEVEVEEVVEVRRGRPRKF